MYHESARVWLHAGAAVVDDHGIQYGNRADGGAVHQPAKEEQQWSDPFGSLKNCADVRISDRISGEPVGFSDI